jgi:hypothetical protein
VQFLDEKKVLAEQDQDDLFCQGIPQHLQKIILPILRVLHRVLKPAGFDPAGEIPTGWEYQCGPLAKTHQEPTTPGDMYQGFHAVDQLSQPNSGHKIIY